MQITYLNRLIIKASRRPFSSDELCHCYSDSYFWRHFIGVCSGVGHDSICKHDVCIPERVTSPQQEACTYFVKQLLYLFIRIFVLENVPFLTVKLRLVIFVF